MFSKYFKWAVLILWLLLILASGYLVVSKEIPLSELAAQIETFLQELQAGGNGWLLPIFFIILFVLRPLLLIPTIVMNLVAYSSFGAWQGFWILLLSEQLSALSFLLTVRYLVGAKAKAKLRNWVSRIRLDLSDEPRKQYYLVLVLRLATLPFDFVTALCALSPIRIIPFQLATISVSIPWIGLFFMMTASIQRGSLSEAILNIFIMILFLLSSSVVARYSKIIKPKDTGSNQLSDL